MNARTFALYLCTFGLVAIAIIADASRFVRSTDNRQQNHHDVMHSHMSRKVFDRACAADKDTLDEIIGCITTNKFLVNTIKLEDANACHKDAFGVDFDANNVTLHRDLMCKHREKFEQMTTCVYRKTAEAVTKEQMDKMAEAMVDVGLCVINALDG